MNDVEIQPEGMCEDRGNYGLCRTHSTCEMVMKELDRLRKEVADIRTVPRSESIALTLYAEREEKQWKPLLKAAKDAELLLQTEIERLEAELSTVDQDLGEASIRESTQWKPLLEAAEQVEMYCGDVGDGEQKLRRKMMREAIAACKE